MQCCSLYVYVVFLDAHYIAASPLQAASFAAFVVLPLFFFFFLDHYNGKDIFAEKRMTRKICVCTECVHCYDAGQKSINRRPALIETKLTG